MFHGEGLDSGSVVTSARVRLELLLAMRPGAGVVGQLVLIDASGLGPEDAVVYLQVVERVEGWLAGQCEPAGRSAASRDRCRSDPRPAAVLMVNRSATT